ncbi:hypothetical protein Nepgr_019546 [Nepenthes gracilis]|uniref:Uncharacterized protein n=1 Tax=Nepenthes gracilis TaxID=150966 RepID=A0AAD3STS0_NEPGR|nr:hypothetical protein Nepgr_019546 [Nepenthes gracilis]
MLVSVRPLDNMELQSVCGSFRSPQVRFSDHSSTSQQIYSPTDVVRRDQRSRLRNAAKSIESCLRWVNKESLSYKLCQAIRVHASTIDKNLRISGRSTTGVKGIKFGEVEPFHGKSGSVSFYGLTYQSLEESKLVSAPFKEDTGSFLWLVAPVAVILSLVLPPLFIANLIGNTFKNEVLAEIVASLSAEAAFYVGLATFLLITDRVQRPYLQFSAKRWGLITGLNGYLTSAFLSMGFKVVAPLAVVFTTWPVLGLQALAAVAPFLVGCLAQLAFESYLDKRRSSCWPLIPVIFEVYRLYQLSKAANYIERSMFAMRELPATNPELMERSSALVAMFVTFHALGLVCLWSLMTFLLRLFPSRPVRENY